MVLFDSITRAIYGPNTNGVTGYVARAVAPEVSYQIGQYFKGNDALNGLDGGDRNGEGSAPHILAHGILAAAVSLATGNDPTTGALLAMGAEAGAKAVSQYLFGVDKPSDLTAEQKQTLSSIVSLAGIGLGATTGDVGSAVSAGEVAQVAVDDNGFNKYAKESEATKQWKAQNRAFVVNQINGILEYKPFDLVYKVAANGDSIVCIPIGSYSCGLRPGEHFASPEEVRKGNSEFLMSVVPIPGGGGAKVIAKKTGQVIGVYDDAKAANAAIQRARVEANIATSKAARESSNFLASQNAKISATLRLVAQQKGNFGIGFATRTEAELMGKAWVGEGYRVVNGSKGTILVSKDGMRQFRYPTPKNSSYATTGTQANFEEFQQIKNTSKRGDVSWKKTLMRNGHLNITD